jgi:hypothetical protein
MSDDYATDECGDEVDEADEDVSVEAWEWDGPQCVHCGSPVLPEEETSEPCRECGLHAWEV